MRIWVQKAGNAHELFSPAAQNFHWFALVFLCASKLNILVYEGNFKIRERKSLKFWDQQALF